MSTEKNQSIVYEVAEGIARVMLNRPPLNILDISMLQQLEAVLEILAENFDVRVLLLKADGKFFSAGVDVTDHTAEKVGEMIPLFNRVCFALIRFPVPTIAVVHGHALGGGCELVLSCDLAVMADEANLGQPEIQLAAFAPVAALRLGHIVGYRTAAELMFSGLNIDASTAFRIGLVNAVVSADDVAGWAEEKALQLGSLSRAAQVFNKRSLQRGYASYEQTLPEIEALYLEELMNTFDAQEGLAAFLEKRPPQWEHR